MDYFLNGRLENTSTMVFSNGWSITINKLHCGHLKIIIVPTHVSEHPERVKRDKYYKLDVMEARGDCFQHFKGDDEDLLDIIVSVACRLSEPSLQATNSMLNEVINKRVKK